MAIVRIAEIADETSMITNREFVQDEIVGPAVLAPVGATSFKKCQFHASLDTLVIVVPNGSVHVGVIGLQQVSFLECVFRNVGLMGTQELFEFFGRDFLREPES